MFTKTFKEYDFDYNVEYGKQNHLEQDASGGKRDDNSILSYFNYDKGDTFYKERRCITLSIIYIKST